MQPSLLAQQRLAVLTGRPVTRRTPISRSRQVVRMAKEDEKPETSSGTDSYSKIEAPVRDTIPDGSKPVGSLTPRNGVLRWKKVLRHHKAGSHVGRF